MANKSMKAADLRSQTAEELSELVRNKEAEILKLKFQKATGQLENVHRVRQVKREIARARTIQTELKLGKPVAKAAAKPAAKPATKAAKAAAKPAAKPAAKRTAKTASAAE